VSPRNVLTIARKELLDTMRDRRTLIFMLLLPIAVIPLLMIGFSKFAKKQLREKESRVLTVAIDPLGENMIRASARNWLAQHVTELVPLAPKLGLTVEMEEISLDGVKSLDLGWLERMMRRVETLRETRDGGMQDAAMVAWTRNYLELPDDDKQLLGDAGAVLGATSRLEYVALDEVGAQRGSLAQGVVIPDGVPDALDDENLVLAIQNKAVHAAVHLPVDLFDRLEEQAISARVHVLHDSSISLSEEAHDRLAGFFAAIERSEVQRRLREAQLSPAFIEPIEMADADVATQSRRIQAVIGGLMPYLILMFCLAGGLYPALDLTAGEKERFTLETLLLSPVTRMEMASGKFVVVFVASLVATVLALLSMGITLNAGILPEGTLEQFELQFETKALLLSASLLLPVAAIFAAALLGIGVFARSFKEAQSYTVPLQFIVVVPAVMAMFPNMETEMKWSWVPLVNVSLLMKELLKGNYLWDFYGVTLASMLALTVLVLWVVSGLFRRESVLLRS